VTAASSNGEISPAELLRLAASMERASEHPLASAIVSAASEQNLTLADVQDFHSHAGKGITGKVAGREIAIGNHALMEEEGIRPGAILVPNSQQGTIVYVSIDRGFGGSIALADPVKTSAASAVAQLKREGLHIVMLTGDNRAVAEAVSCQLGIEDYRAEVLPQDKSQVIKDLQEQGRIVAMAGDGINDAPALAQAHVGIAMGTGTDVAIESAGITLLKGDLAGIVRARKLSRATMKNIRQNLFFAFIYNSIGVPIAAGILYPFFGVLLSPILAAAAMSFSSVSVITNSLRLRSVKL